MNVWDVGGQTKLRAYWRNYFEQTEALVWVIDSADRLRMQECKQELHALLLEERLQGASLLVVANKQDLKGALREDEIREVLDLDGLKTHTWRMVGCSAVTGEHVEEGLTWVVDDVGHRLYSFL